MSNRFTTFALACASVAVSAPALAMPGAEDLALTPENVSFQFVPHQDHASTPCVHKVLNAASYDWSVECKDPFGATLKYTVHLALTRFDTREGPVLESLYWVTEHLAPEKNHGTSQTTVISFADAIALKKIELRHGVQNDSAYLAATLKF